jgi:hypothetical protein
MGTWGSFPGGKEPGSEADHSPPTNVEVKKLWIFTSTPTYAFTFIISIIGLMVVKTIVKSKNVM